MNSDFPPLTSVAALPDRVLCFAPHPDDEVIGCGGLLALLKKAGKEVRIVYLTSGGRADLSSELALKREEEARRATQQLGGLDTQFLGLEDGGLGTRTNLAEMLAACLAESDAGLVLTPSPFEHHPDHRAATAALCAALAGRECQVLLYGVNQAVPADLLVDTTAVIAEKRAALECFESQLEGTDLIEKVLAADRARTINVDQNGVRCAEGFTQLSAAGLAAHVARVNQLRGRDESIDLPRTTAVISSWNKIEEVRANLTAVFSQTLPFAKVVVVDNASTDGSIEMIRKEFPAAHLTVMQRSDYGACETFNIGFAQADTELTAILDDDIVMPNDWLAKATARLVQEPATTAVLSTKVVEPGMPESYKNSPEVNSERYMSTFRGCASLARSAAIKAAGYYDERLFIYGNERDLTCRLLNLGFRVLQYPGTEVFHHTPFGLKPGKRSLFYHARNSWLSMLKYAPLPDLLRMPWLVFSRVVLRSSKSEAEGEVRDAVGTIGIGRSLKETPGAWWIVTKAAASVIYNLPYCLKRREPVQAEDFELPIH